MPAPASFQPLPPVGAVLYGSVSLNEDLNFYPEIHYQELLVQPVAWAVDTDEPILRVNASPSTMDSFTSKYFLELAARINARYPEDVMLADGWRRPDQAVYEKHFHVDELEKIEGPLPDGPF